MKPNEMEVGWVVVADIGECFVRGRVMEKTEEGGLIVKDEWATDVEIIKMNEQLVFFGKEEHYYVCSRARMDEATMYEEV